MARQDTYFEKKRYFEWTASVLEESSKTLGLWLSNFTSLTRESSISFLKSAAIRSEKENFPKINASFLLDGLTNSQKEEIRRTLIEDVKKNNPKRIPKNSKVPPGNQLLFSAASNQSIISAVEQALKDRTDEEIEAICINAICRHADVASIFKLITFADSKDVTSIEGYSFDKTLGDNINCSIDTIQDKSASCNKLRNTYQGHVTVDKIEKVSKKEFKKNIGVIRDCLDCAKYDSNSNVGQSFINTKRGIDSILSSLESEPLTFATMTEMVDGFDLNFILDYARTYNDYDRETKTLYWHSLEEVKKIVAERTEGKKDIAALLSRMEGLESRNMELQEGFEKASSFSSGLVDSLTNIISAINDYNAQIGKPPISVAHQSIDNTTNEAEPMPLISKVLLSDVMPNMNEYNGGSLTAKQLDELAENTIVLADANFWIDRNGSSYLARSFNKLIKKYSRKIIVDWSTRVELFEIEKNEKGLFSAEEVRAAKTAHETMSQMHRHGYVRYLQPDEEVVSSRKNILRLLGENPTTPFTVFTASKDFCDQMMEEGINNAIPVYVLPNVPSGEHPERIRPSALPLLRACFDNELVTRNVQTSETIRSDEETKKKDEAEKESIEGETIQQYEQKKTEKSVDSVISQSSNQSYISPKDLPKESEAVSTRSGSSIVLRKELARGGEGIVYSTNQLGIVAKIYLLEKNDQERMEKIGYMCEHNPHISQLCWPEEMLFDKAGAFIGYTMQDASRFTEFGVSILKLNSPRVRDNSMKGWDRLSLVKLCKKIGEVFFSMHRKGVLMGDVNPRNMMIDPASYNNPSFVFVDCDSYQVDKYPCPVGTMPFTSPQIYKKANKNPREFKFGDYMRTIEDENYAVASLFFNILMLNQSPFAGKGTTNIEESMMNYNFAYRISGDRDNTGVDTPDGPFRLIWNNTPKSVKDNFVLVFKDGKDVKVDQWIQQFNWYSRVIEKGNYTSELTPVLYWDYAEPEKRRTIDFTCDACGAIRNMPKERYENEEKWKAPHLCNDCRSASFRLKADSDLVETICSECNNRYQVNKWDAWLIDRGYKRNICKECNQVVTLTCVGCGKEYQAKNYMRNRKYCNECTRMSNVPCGRCGRYHNVKIGKLKMLEREGRESFCDDCITELRNRRR